MRIEQLILYGIAIILALPFGLQRWESVLMAIILFLTSKSLDNVT
jgi:hypothetical protein